MNLILCDHILILLSPTLRTVDLEGQQVRFGLPNLVKWIKYLMGDGKVWLSIRDSPIFWNLTLQTVVENPILSSETLPAHFTHTRLQPLNSIKPPPCILNSAAAAAASCCDLSLTHMSRGSTGFPVATYRQEQP